MMKGCIIFLGFMGVFYGCAIPSGPMCRFEGIEYGTTKGVFHGDWADYYERALSYMDGNCYEAAIADLNAAIEQEFKDERMAKTYGMHFIDYFPHREKGVAYYEIGDDEAAQKELEVSLRQAPSNKAIVYLDKVRKRLLEIEQPEVSKPEISLNVSFGVYRKSGEIFTKADPIPIKGIAEDRQFIHKILIDGNPIFIEGSKRRLEFEKELNLEQGRHEIDVIAENLLGGKNIRNIVIVVDRSGPVIAIEKMVLGESIDGYIRDDSEIDHLYIDGKSIDFRKGNESNFSYPIETDPKKIEIIATDILGNRTTAEISTTSPSNLTAANMRSEWVSDAENPYGFQSQNILKASASKPKLYLVELENNDIAYKNRIFLKGHVDAGEEITRLTIGDQSILYRPGRLVFFNQPYLLDIGVNRIAFTAETASGGNMHHDLTIIRKTPAIHQNEYRYGIVFYPFKHSYLQKNNASIDFDRFLNYFLISLNEENRFRIMLQNDLRTSLEVKEGIGKDFQIDRLVPPYSLVAGVIHETAKGIEVAVRFIDRISSETIDIIDIYSESKDNIALGSMAERLSDKLRAAFPLEGGNILDKHGKYIIVKAEKGKLRIGWPLLLYRPEKSYMNNQLKAETLGVNTEIIGNGIIVEKSRETYNAQITEKQKIPIKPGYRIFSR